MLLKGSCLLSKDCIILSRVKGNFVTETPIADIYWEKSRLRVLVSPLPFAKWFNKHAYINLCTSLNNVAPEEANSNVLFFGGDLYFLINLSCLDLY